MRVALAMVVMLVAGPVHAEDILTPGQVKDLSTQQMRDVAAVRHTQNDQAEHYRKLNDDFDRRNHMRLYSDDPNVVAAYRKQQAFLRAKHDVAPKTYVPVPVVSPEERQKAALAAAEWFGAQRQAGIAKDMYRLAKDLNVKPGSLYVSDGPNMYDSPACDSRQGAC